MKKTVLILLLVLASTAMVFSLDVKERDIEEVRHFQLQNTFIGFGVGSRHQGDRQSANTLLGLDIAGTTLTVSGGLGLAGSIIMYNMVEAFIGEVTKADIYISAGVLGAGIVTLIVSKALGISYPLKF
ncbi:MAG: P13 family porin [Spirochaetales bacterium]|nr:P13 family porin [Spirochaetales bacterium]